MFHGFLAAQLAHALAAVDQSGGVALHIALGAQEGVRVGEMANPLQRLHITDGALNCAGAGRTNRRSAACLFA